MNGIIIFSHNNGYIDYVKIACASAGYARRNLSGFDEICLITDEESLSDNKELVDMYFDRVIKIPVPKDSTMRMYHDTHSNKEPAKFINTNRGNVYDLSPYDETLVIDCDYFAMTNVLDGVWGSKNDFMITKNYSDISNDTKNDITKISDTSIDMYWATILYFRKSEFSKTLFKLVDIIKNNWQWYYIRYSCNIKLYRNDHTFSIALHIITNGSNDTVPELPMHRLMNSFDTDKIFRIDGPANILMLTAMNKKSKNMVRLQQSDLHIMNKQSILNHIDNFFEYGYCK
ncbi:hypothetical protein N9I00_00335 [bacterium]|nr:hypothetical protein [bacterium]